MRHIRDSGRDIVVGREMHDVLSDLFPICRSITGEGVRATLRTLQKRIPLTIQEVASGTQVFDWTVPLEWNIHDAYVKDLEGHRIIDFQKSNLHVVSYSHPINRRVSLEELRTHLHSLPDHPAWIPYRTSYYKDSWGFCLSHNELQKLRDAEYDVCIDASLTQGFLSYGEYFVPGQVKDEVLFSTHICHPSLCNDNLSGIGVATFLAEWVSSKPRRYSYRFLFIPGTIGSITWLSQNRERASQIKHGLVLTGVGDPGPFTYKRSRRGNSEIDRIMGNLLRHSGSPYDIVDFIPYGYDERQFCSPGFNLPVGCFSRTPHSQYPEYHTSGDSMDFVRAESLEESLEQCRMAVETLERNRTYINKNPHCEPQLGKRGLYRAIGGQAGEKSMEMALLWVLSLSDGYHSLLEIAERSDIRFELLAAAAEKLTEHALLSPAPYHHSS